MTETVDISEAYDRVFSLPKITLEDADRLARDYGLEITGPDPDGYVEGLIHDQRTKVSGGFRLAHMDSALGKAWLAWRERAGD